MLSQGTKTGMAKHVYVNITLISHKSLNVANLNVLQYRIQVYNKEVINVRLLWRKSTADL